MSDVKIVTRYENDHDQMIEITKDLKEKKVTIRVDDGDEVEMRITVPDYIWEQLS